MLNHIVDKYISTYIIKMKPIDVRSSTYINYDVLNGDEVSKFKVCDYVRISQYKNAFAKYFIPN